MIAVAVAVAVADTQLSFERADACGAASLYGAAATSPDASDDRLSKMERTQDEIFKGGRTNIEGLG